MVGQRAALKFCAVLVLLLINCSASVPELTINNCRARKYSFVNENAKKVKGVWSITANGHCGSAVDVYEVTSDSKSKSKKKRLWEGLYESYGISDGVRRYEHVLSNGTVFKLMRRSVGGQYYWLLGRGGVQLQPYFYSMSVADSPPVTHSATNDRDDGTPTVWSVYDSGRATNAKSATNLRIKVHHVPEVSPVKKKLELVDFEYDEDNEGHAVVVGLDGSVEEPSRKELAESKLLDSMLHPAVSTRFGKFLRKSYRNADPVPGISLDGLINYRLLLKSLDFVNSPIDGDEDDPSRWIGPESVAYCCHDKFRLDFKHWRGSKYSRALQSIASNARFIGFLEAMTTIRGLVPVR